MSDPATWAVISLVISAGTAIYASSLNLDVTDQADNGQTINKSGTSASRNPVYGTCRTGAVPVYNNVNNNNSAQLLNVFACGIGVSAIRQVYIDDATVLTVAGQYKETSGGGFNQLRFSGSDLSNGFEKQCEIQIRAGLPTGVPMQMAIDFGDGEWTTDMRGDNVCAMAIKSERIIDDEGIRIMSENFEVNLLVDGLALYDPRTGRTSFFDSSAPVGYQEVGRNPALACLDYLKSTYYGVGIPDEYINEQSFIDVANWCDGQGYKIDGQIDSSSSFATALKGILDCAGLILTVENGEIHIHYEDKALPSANFDESNIINETFNVTEANSSSYFNVVEVEYKNSELNDDQDVYTIPDNVNTDPQIMSDGFINSSTLSMPFVRLAGSDVNNVAGQIRTLANRELRKSQFLRTCSFDTDLQQNPVQIFDVITVTDENLNWNRKQFRVTDISKSINDDAGINIATLKCIEYDDSIYDGSKEGTTPSKPVPKPVITPPTGLDFDLYDYVTDGYGTFSWSRTWYETECDYIVDYKRQSDLAWTRLGRTQDTEYKVARLQPDVYEFRVATNSNIYGTSNFAVLRNVQITPLGILPPVTGTVGDFNGVNCHFFWDDMLPEPVSGYPDSPESGQRLVSDIFSHYRISLFDSADDLIGTANSATNEYVYSYTQNAIDGLNRQVRAEIEIVAVDGTMSAIENSSIFTAKNEQCAVPTIRYENTSFNTTIIELDPPPELETDYRITKFYSDTTSGFTPIDAYPPVGNLLAEQVGNVFTHVWDDELTHYIRIAHVDVFGNDEQKISGETQATPTPIELPIDDRFSEIRNPEGATGSEQVFKAADGAYVAGLGIYADAANEETTTLLASDNFLMGVGGRPYWDAGLAYNVGDKVIHVWGADAINETGYFECIVANTGNAPTHGGDSFWLMHQGNINQSIFAVQDDGRVLVENATIENLNGEKITVNTLHGDRIVANSIEGGQISSSTTVLAGSGTTQAGMNGYDSGIYNGWRFWSGSSTPSTAPYRVSSTGAVNMTNATVTGGSLNINNNFVVASNGITTIRSAASGSRLIMSGDRLEVYEGSTLRVRLGRL